MDYIFTLVVGILTSVLSFFGFAQQPTELPQATYDQAQQATMSLDSTSVQSPTPTQNFTESQATPSSDFATITLNYTLASFEATPLSGFAPLTVNFKGQINVLNNQPGSAVIFFGDGVSDVMFRSDATTFKENWTHTYSRPGEYDAYLVISTVSNVDSDIEVMKNPNYYKNVVVKKIHVSVGSQVVGTQ